MQGVPKFTVLAELIGGAMLIESEPKTKLILETLKSFTLDLQSISARIAAIEEVLLTAVEPDEEEEEEEDEEVEEEEEGKKEQPEDKTKPLCQRCGTRH